jgi:protoheme IX farnesyltransferase
MSITSTPIPLDAPVEFRWSAFALDVLELTKPRIALMALIAVVVSGIVARWGQPDVWLMLHAVIGIALVAASASASNQWLERELDLAMPRTADRPLPSGRLTATFVAVFSIITAVAGLCYLIRFTDPITALLGAVTWLMYVVIYTPLKTKTWMNTGVGAVAGAMPVALGWHAVGGAWDARMAAMFCLLFLWQFPHFMAIAWLYRDDYAQAGMKMLTVVDPTGQRAGVQAVLAAAALIPVSLFPVLYYPGLGSLIYLAAALLLGLGQLALSIHFFRSRTERSARKLLRASLVYLPATLLLLVLLLVLHP